jgi:hypothetical protein
VFACVAPSSVAFLVAVFGPRETVFAVCTAVIVLGSLIAVVAGLETRGKRLGEPIGPMATMVHF